MESKTEKFTADKVLIVAVVVGMFALAAAGSIFSPKSSTIKNNAVANNLSQNCMYINR